MIIQKDNSNIIKIKSTYETAPNIAFVKYWGKFHEEYILPLNTSIGITLKPENFHLKIKSENSFPTASGLASSSSGLAAISLCLFDIYHFQEEYFNQKSEIARLGSGSASRSIFGGLVQWNCVSSQKQQQIEQQNNNIDILEELSKICVAQQVFDDQFFKDVQILVLAYSFENKEVSSTDGMKITRYTFDAGPHAVPGYVFQTEVGSGPVQIK
ncbi:hypothetical protein IMG5_181080 [Ichthyophthirius multifiliis]|uniref:Diphosphomevalonate decarboxylase-like N-terminal domain-containing protein n=1 Tax=Ichthyophthirius multifiliis TaxID=5932 RepID=G0R2W8_ICHMU|nr:hypothetical protein IMG5_181080 [Ichthyophthirius multifiliis]EGR28179.1 hypothetical protein IMG5_181080 [Ichthyophthirius multifiliis]|eukprot:XP_004027524.1 hypothetical protein IMG5_181080 [Ichthyophthirius multifiliis]